jgi:hypothetical protein
MRKFITKRRAAALSFVAVLAITGAAVAYFTSSGTGTGTASVTAGSSNLTYVTTSITAMYPGDSSQPFTVTVSNNSTTQKEYVNGVSAYITTDQAGCTGSDFLLNGSAAPSDLAHAVALGWTGKDLAANGGSAVTAGDTIQFNDTSSNQDVCKGASVTLNYTSVL